MSILLWRIEDNPVGSYWRPADDGGGDHNDHHHGHSVQVPVVPPGVKANQFGVHLPDLADDS